MASHRRRPSSPFWDVNVDRGREPSPSKGHSAFTRSLMALVDRASGAQPDPSNPVVNGASEADKPWLRGLLAEVASQIPRAANNMALISSVANTKLFDGGLVDDKTYQMEKIIQLVASLPANTKAQDDLSNGLIGALWRNLQHPPLSLQSPSYRYRTADGSNNNLMYPNLGRAGSSYARTVTPKTLQPGILPDPAVVFDALFARSNDIRDVKDHPNKISSMLFYLASIIIHDVFHTDPIDHTKVKTSSYLDLAPLYGSSDAEQARIRLFRDGLLKPDTFSENRILGFPPGVGALLVCFNRYHNYIAIQLKEINEKGRFNSVHKDDEAGVKRLDEDLFQTARLITCGLYVNIVLSDYVRTILNLNRGPSTWSLDPRDNSEYFDAMGVPQGIGNQVSVEFNLVYRWHSATSRKDEEWTKEAYKYLFPGQDVDKLTEKEFAQGVRKWITKMGDDPSKWPLDFDGYKRKPNGCFPDTDLVQILQDATEDVACAFGPRQVPIAMKLIEIMGIKQARAWNVATLNEFRKFFSLSPHKEFSDISSDTEIQHALKALYKHPDYVELYPGLVAEDAKESMVGSGICLGFTTSRTILADAVALVRGDRFYTVDYSPANLTNWGFNQIKSDPDVAQGHCIYNLFMRALPGYYRGNSVYAMFPFVHPDENRKILHKLGTVQDYNFDEPSFIVPPPAIRSWIGVQSVLSDQNRFAVPWGEHIEYLTGHNFMLGNDEHKSTVDHKNLDYAIFCPKNGMDQIRRFYEALTRQLIVIGQERLRDDWFQLDICRDVAQPSHSVFVAKLWHIPLKAKGDSAAFGIPVDKMYLAMSVMFAYVFLDGDTARSFRLRAAAKSATDQLSELCKIVCTAVRANERLPVSRVFRMGEEGQTLESYGKKLIHRMFDNGWDVDTVVANMIPTAVAAAATQAQHMTQMIDLYLRDEYKHHWPQIQKHAQSDDPSDFEALKSYALEANRLSPASYGVLRKATRDTTIDDHGRKVHVGAGNPVYLNFLTAGMDERLFPNPSEIKLNRPRESYIHHGWGMHKCIGREIVEVAMASQLKVIAQLKNLRRAPGPQGEMKFIYPQPNPVSSDPHEAVGHIKAFMKEDWGDFWPFPTTLKVHHDGFVTKDEAQLKEQLFTETGLPNVRHEVIASSRGNSRSRSRSRSSDMSRSPSRSRSRPPVPSEYMSRKAHAEYRDPQSRVDSFENDLAYDDGGYDSQDGNDELDMSGILSNDLPPRIRVNRDHLDPNAAERRGSASGTSRTSSHRSH